MEDPTITERTERHSGDVVTYEFADGTKAVLLPVHGTLEVIMGSLFAAGGQRTWTLPWGEVWRDSSYPPIPEIWPYVQAVLGQEGR